MKHVVRSWRPVARAVALAVVVAVLPIPGFAADDPPPVATPSRLAASIRKAAAAERLDAAQAKQAPDATKLESPAFFKSKVGLVVIGVFAAGVAYATYSLSHDRIHSTTREGRQEP